MSLLSEQLPLHEVCVVGEYTTDNGPFDEDFFLVVVTTSNGWIEMPMASSDAKQFYDRFEQAVGKLAPTRLVTSTDFQSNILWPPDIAGKQLFEFKPVSRGLLACIKAVFGSRYVAVTLSAEVEAILKRH